MSIQPWDNDPAILHDLAQSQAREPIPVTYHVRLAPELARALEVYCAAAGPIRHETAIAEAVRAFLGVDQ